MTDTFHVAICGIDGDKTIGDADDETLVAIEVNGVPLVGIDFAHTNTDNNDEEEPYLTIGWWGSQGDGDDNPWRVLASLPVPAPADDVPVMRRLTDGAALDEIDNYSVGDHVSPIGQPHKHGVVAHVADDGYVTVAWDVGVVAPGTPNPIEEAPGDLQPFNTDAHALDAIAEMLRDPDWGVGMLEDIAQIVTRTGRSVETRHDSDGDPINTWDRH